MENYKEFGPHLFKMSIPFSPAKRLGVPEEVCATPTHTHKHTRRVVCTFLMKKTTAHDDIYQKYGWHA